MLAIQLAPTDAQQHPHKRHPGRHLPEPRRQVYHPLGEGGQCRPHASEHRLELRNHFQQQDGRNPQPREQQQDGIGHRLAYLLLKRAPLLQHARQLLELPIQRPRLLTHPHQIAVQRIEPARMALQGIREPQPCAQVFFQRQQHRRLPLGAAATAHHFERLQQRHTRSQQGRQLPTEARRVRPGLPTRPAQCQPTRRPYPCHRDALANQRSLDIGRAAPRGLAADGGAAGVRALPGVEMRR